MSREKGNNVKEELQDVEENEATDYKVMGHCVSTVI